MGTRRIRLLQWKARKGRDSRREFGIGSSLEKVCQDPVRAKVQDGTFAAAPCHLGPKSLNPRFESSLISV
eukprot:1437664-Rhodomonas_salina.7